MMLKNVQDMIARNDYEILMIVERERELLDLMKAQVYAEKAKISDGKTILESLGLEIRECRDSETANIFKHLHPDTAPKSDKSQRYTSLMGSYWTHGNSNKGYIAVFKVLYNLPYE